MTDPRYRFRHAITRDIAYGLLLFSQKSELHRSVALSLERAHADDLDAVATTLAYHWRNSLSAESESGRRRQGDRLLWVGQAEPRCATSPTVRQSAS